MRNHTRILQVLFGLCVFSIVLMVCTVPIFFALPVSAVAVFLLRRSQEPYAIGMIASPIAVLLVVSEVLLRVLPADIRPQYYRPHELLVRSGEGGVLANYQPNKRIESFRIPHGDLAALSFVSTIVDPRVVDFQTDSLGFRNTRDYAGQRFVIFGDSFAVGSSTSQEGTLGEVLTRSFDIPAYNAGFPGTPDEYIERIVHLTRRYGEAFKGIVLVFEGNDFPCAEEEAAAHLARRRAKRSFYVPGEIRHLQTYRLLYGLTRRAFYTLVSPARARDNPRVLIEQVGGQDVAFLTHYIQATIRREGCDWAHYRDLFQPVSSRIALIVFVPTKYRVYYPLLGSGARPSLPHVQARFLESLARDMSLPYLDVTPHLVAASRAHLERGAYTFWRDDTHWNGRGIAAAADAIAEALRRRGLVPAPASSLDQPGPAEPQPSPAHGTGGLPGGTAHQSRRHALSIKGWP